MRTLFQRGLSSPTAAQQFLPFFNEVIDDWFQNLEKIRTRKTEVDYLPELARLFLERKYGDLSFIVLSFITFQCWVRWYLMLD